MKARKSDLEKFFDKAGCNRPGPQRTAEKLWLRIKGTLPAAEESAILIAWGHATMVAHNEGRGELDVIRARVFKGIEERSNAATR